jgi:hypothetical protein
MANIGQRDPLALLRLHLEQLQDPHCTPHTHLAQRSERAQRIKRGGGIRLYWQAAVNRDFVLRRSNSRAASGGSDEIWMRSQRSCGGMLIRSRGCVRPAWTGGALQQSNRSLVEEARQETSSSGHIGRRTFV